MKVAVLLSGGVDSSTALWQLKRSGCTDLTAYYLKVWLEDELSYMGDCPWEEDLSYAQAVCDQAGVPLRVVSLQLEYYERVVEYALSELKAGRTPSPDIFCNQRIKFGAFFDHIDESYDKVATGHYARVGEDDGLFRLKRAPDPVKDQSYFLSHLSQFQMSRVLFPVGELLKSRVRDVAHELNLPNRDRKDSQGICFLGKIRYPEFIRHYLGEREGPIIEEETGEVVGTHRGYWFHTIGQRQGLGLGSGPWYVVRKNITDNEIYVSHSNHVSDRARSRFRIGNLNWIAGAPSRTVDLLTKIRHGPQLYRCTISARDATGGQVIPERAVTLDVAIERPDRGVAPGQFAVLYDGEVCLGGGMILEDA